MFDFFKNKKGSDQKLINQAVGGQSVLFIIFREVFKENPEEVKKIELTYFALSVLTYIFFGFSSLTKEEKETTADRVADAVLKKSIPSAGNEVSTENAIVEYQHRYREYNSLISEVFKEGGVDGDSCITLTMHVYESVMGKSAQEKMIEIVVASSLVAQYIVDHIEFIKEKKL
jgi:hypothetical protein